MTESTPSAAAAPASRAVRPLTVLLGLVLTTLLLTGCLPSNAQSFVDRTNGLRASRGVPALVGHGTLDPKAQAWAETLAARGTLVHSSLTDGMATVGWRTIGENLASGSDTGDWPARLHDALVASPTHHANLVDRRFTHMGVGVARSGGQVYVVEVFAEIR